MTSHLKSQSRRTAARSLLITAVLAGCSGGGAQPSTDEAAPAVVGAQTSVVSTRPFTETMSAIGTVQPRVGHVATLSSSVQGRVIRILVSVGDRVAAGQPLIELDSAVPYAIARSAEAAVTAATLNEDRSRRLVLEGISPRREVEQATADLARSRAELITARRQAELTTVRAPIAGAVTRMTTTIGATVDVAQPLVEIADPSMVDIVLSTTAHDAARIRLGAPVSLLSGEGTAREHLGTGRVMDIGAAIDTATRTVPVRIQVQSILRPLRIGEAVLGDIQLVRQDDAIAVSIVALVPDGDGFKVFVVDSQGVAVSRAVQIGARTDSVVEIVSGLTAGLRIVTTGAYGVTDGARVVPLP